MIKGKYISPGNRKINYMGRIDFTDREKPLLIYAGSTLTFRFTGSRLTVLLDNISFNPFTKIGYLVDNQEYNAVIPENASDFALDITIGNNARVHAFTIFKKMDGSHLLRVKGFYLDENADIVDQPPLPSRKIECYGDSVCCGEVCEAVSLLGKLDPEDHNGKFNNSWYGFPIITARLLNAQINNVSQGGMAVMNGTGWCFEPVFPGLESIYTKLQYTENYPKSEWNFSDYTPNVVIIALGQNDSHRDGHPDNDITDHEYRTRWKSAYSAILSDLLGKYPHATFILLTTLLMHDVQWDIAIDEVKDSIGSCRVHRFYFRRNGTAALGHPRIPEQEEMAAELAEFIISLGEGIWVE